MANDIFIKHLGSAVQSWLNYISAVDREFVLSESSIKFPLSEFIGTKLENDNVHLEKLHPNLDRKLLDLFCNQEYNATMFECAYEFKFIKAGSTLKKTEKQRILNDLMRLHVFISTKKKRKAYFLICGSQHEFIESFQSIPPKNKSRSRSNNSYVRKKPSGFYTKWFKFDLMKPTRIIKLNLNDSTYGSFYKTYNKKYKSPFKKKMKTNYILPARIKTRLIFLSEDSGLKNVPTPMKLAIWEVQN